MMAGAKFVDTNERPVKPDTSISDANYSGRQVEEIIRFLETKYVGDISSDELVEKAIQAIMKGLDPHTHYFPPDQVDELEEKTKGHYVGIGVEIMFIGDSLVVLYPKENSPAEKAGIKPGDYIIAINDHEIPADSMTELEIIDLIKGSRGSRIKLRIKPMLEDEIKTIDIVRDEIKVPSILSAYMVDTTVAYIRISRFTNTTYKEFMDQWERLATKENAKHLILDLRDNPGGYLREAVNILSQIFSEEGKILVYTEGKNHNRNEYKSTGKVFFTVENVAILINENSASASEIIAGCIQDQDRGVVIGTRSYGKGLVQEQYELSNGATLRLTVSKYYTPSGRLIQKAYDEESIVDTTEIFKTANGRLVRAGGGIEPDINVAEEVNWNLPIIKSWMDIISEYAIRYNLVHHDGDIISPDHVEEVRTELPERKEILYELGQLMKRRNQQKLAELDNFKKANEEMIYKLAVTSLIAYRTGEEGWYRAANHSDPVVLKAKSIIKEDLSKALAQE